MNPSHPDLFMRQPATRWTDGLPCGNGTLGAMMFGHLCDETILLNHEALWRQSPRPELPDVLRHAGELRERCLASNFDWETQTWWAQRLREAGYEGKIDPYQPAGELRLSMPPVGIFHHYRRSLDFATGEAVVQWVTAGTVHTHRLFVSRADDVVVLQTSQVGEVFLAPCVTFDLGDDAGPCNETLLAEAYEETAPTALIERMTRFGRYLLISSVGKLPPNLQGLWNGDYDPAWSSDYHNDVNIQMAYWQALTGRLPELVQPCADYYERFLDDYRENARKLYGCEGILLPVAQSTHGLVFPRFFGAWTAGAGWLGQLLYDHWLHTGDRHFLATHTVPWLLATACFYEMFAEMDTNNCLRFAPSVSPENSPLTDPPGFWPTSVNATMDIAVAKEVFTNLIAACRELGIHAAAIPRWAAWLDRLPSYEIDDGCFREWLWPAVQENHAHRHHSHLYPLFPGLELIPEEHPALCQAIHRGACLRLQHVENQTGWSLASLACVFARLNDGARALHCLDLLLRTCTGPNLLTYHNDWRSMGLTVSNRNNLHPPFQIDANLGFTAAVQEMLLYSRPGLIKLLPALPDAWPIGRVTGLHARGGITIDLAWQDGQAAATLTSERDIEIEVLPIGRLCLRAGILQSCPFKREHHERS